MRGVTVFLCDTTSARVEELLARLCPIQHGPPWIWPARSDRRWWRRAKDPVLYVNLYHGGVHDFASDPEVWASVTSALGVEPSIAVQVDVSGRHPGAAELQEFLSEVLRTFTGCVQDEYTSYCWTLDEVLAGHDVQGHPFFDYEGWHRAGPA